VDDDRGVVDHDVVSRVCVGDVHSVARAPRPPSGPPSALGLRPLRSLAVYPAAAYRL
jgi:hypothetical protein